VVPESQRSETFFRKLIIAFGIKPRVRIQIMLSAIDFDDQTMLEADEINDVARSRRLAPEMESPLAPFTQMDP
jgi:hypothetical protein